MKSTVEKLDKTRTKITLDVPYEELKPAMTSASKKLSQQVNIPGFRKGKVPTRVLENYIGRGAILEQAINDSLDGYYQEALTEHDLKPISRPDVTVNEYPEEGQDFTFTIEVDVRPEIELPKLKDIEVTVEKSEISDDDVEERLTAMRERFATLKTVERAVKSDDYVSIDMDAVIGDETVDSVSGLSYQLGSGQLLEGIDDALEGLKAGESATFTTTLAGGDHEGEEAEVTVTVQSVKESELPEADDDFAQLASEFDTLDEFREDLREQVGKDKMTNVVYSARDLLLAKLVEATDVPVPKSLIDDEIQRHLESEGKEAGDPHGEEIREDTEKAFRDQMILDELVAQNDITIGQDELLEFMVQQAQMYGIEPNKFIQASVETNQLQAFASELTRNKALILALREISVVDGDGNAVDVTSIINENEGIDSEEQSEESAKAAAAQTVSDETRDEGVEQAEASEEAREESSKAAEKKAPAKKPATKKATATKKPATKKAADDEDSPAKDDEEKAPAKKAPAKKPAAAKKAPAKKPAAAKEADADKEPTAEKKAPAKKTTASKTTAAKKPAAKKAPAKKAETVSDEVRDQGVEQAEASEKSRAKASKAAEKKAPAKKVTTKKASVKATDEK